MNQALEERLLFLLLLLRQPRLRMVYVTSQPIDPLIVEYYLSLLPGVIPSHARARLSLVSVGDSGPEPLTEKLLARPRVIRQDPGPHPGPDRLPPHPLQHDERRARPRGAARHPDVRRGPQALPPGHQDGVPTAVRARRGPLPRGVRGPALPRRPREVAGVPPRRSDRTPPAAMVKLNEGVSGAGNAVVDLRDLPAPGSPDEADAVAAAWSRPWSSRTRRIDVARLPGEARGTGRHRRGADRRRRAAQPERADAGDPRG